MHDEVVALHVGHVSLHFVAHRDADHYCVIVVGGGAEDGVVLADAQSPRVVVELAYGVQCTAVAAEAENAAAQDARFCIGRLAGTEQAAVADRAPDMVVDSHLEVVHHGVRVECAERIVNDYMLLVESVVAVRILQEDDVGSLADDCATLYDGNGRGERLVLSEPDEMIRRSVAVRVLADGDAVGARLLSDVVMRIVGGLDDPEPATLVPGERDGIDNVRLRGKHAYAEAVRDDEPFGALHGR